MPRVQCDLYVKSSGCLLFTSKTVSHKNIKFTRCGVKSYFSIIPLRFLPAAFVVG